MARRTFTCIDCPPDRQHATTSPGPTPRRCPVHQEQAKRRAAAERARRRTRKPENRDRTTRRRSWNAYDKGGSRLFSKAMTWARNAGETRRTWAQLGPIVRDEAGNRYDAICASATETYGAAKRGKRDEAVWRYLQSEFPVLTDPATDLRALRPSRAVHVPHARSVDDA